MYAQVSFPISSFKTFSYLIPKKLIKGLKPGEVPKDVQKQIEKARINIYNILAILIVIIPEFFAELIYTLKWFDPLITWLIGRNL